MGELDAHRRRRCGGGRDAQGPGGAPHRDRQWEPGRIADAGRTDRRVPAPDPPARSRIGTATLFRRRVRAAPPRRQLDDGDRGRNWDLSALRHGWGRVVMGATTEPRVLLEEIAFPESPRWHDGRIWFSDWLAHQVIAVDESGEAEVITEVDAFPFSIDWLPGGSLTMTAGRKVLRMDGDGSLAPYADLSGLTEFGLNEIVVDGRGLAYVNGAGF